MEFQILIILLIFLLINGVKDDDLTINYFNFQLIDENVKPNSHISTTVSEDGYLFIVSGKYENLEDNLNQRFITIYNINTSSFVKKYVYNTSFGFNWGEAYAFTDKSQYLFISTSGGSYAIRDIRDDGGKIWNDTSIYGYRRFFKKADSFYYFAHIDAENKNYLFLKRMEIDYYKDNIPHFEIVKTSKEIEVDNTPIITCDLTNDNNYIICAYYSQNQNISISAFDKNLDVLLSQTIGFVDYHDFIKIVYFKDNTDFILMNYQKEYITRLRYFNYTDNKFNDKLSSIIQKSQTYLDIENTQKLGHFYYSDLMRVDSDKIIKISYQNPATNMLAIIIITIIQFYDNDTSMSIKIYNTINNNGFDIFYDLKISMLKQSFVICSSARHNGQRRLPGYFIINYPNSTDINLVKSNIKIEDLIKLENKLFSIKLKLKILSIPDGFKLISKSNSLEINNNDEFELNDELILRQYRINEGPYILKYQSIARGTDLGYSYLTVYPPEKVLINKEMLFEGRHGIITIDLKNCFEGYYNLDYDENLCTNVKPKGYYLDEEKKMYRACPITCEDCNAPDATHINCLSCKPNYYLTIDTFACYEKEANYYYFDEDSNKLRKCHKNCLKCYGKAIDDNNMNCYECPDNSYMIEFTKSCYDYIPNHYYFDNEDKVLKSCYKTCFNCLGPGNEEEMNCSGCISDEYFFKNDTHNCILPKDYKKRNDLEFRKINSINFYIFIAIFFVALMIFILVCKYYKIKENDRQQAQNNQQPPKKKEPLIDKKKNEKDNKMVEMQNKSGDNDNNNNNNNNNNENVNIINN